MPAVAAATSVLVLEFNELSPTLMERFIAAGELPNFERLRSESTVMITDPEEPQASLNPWIQWVTLHSGVARAEHGIEKLGEASRLEHPTMSEVIASSGRAVVIFGSMNLPERSVPHGVYVPDPWNPEASPQPAALAAFTDFVRANVQEHTNEEAGISVAAAARFSAFMVRHGLSRATATAAVRQLIGERRGSVAHFARACVLDRLQWDVFRWYARRERPALATFFSNSTAHFQHMYWRNMEPERFANQPTSEEQARYQDAVLRGYRSMDALVAEAIALADELDATLMLCTALSQQPYLLAEQSGGKFAYRPRDFDRLLEAVGVDAPGNVAPVMAEQFHVRFESSDSAGEAADRFRQATVDGEPAFIVRLDGEDVFTGCRITWTLPDDAELVDADGGTERFHDLFYRFETAKSGYHHPDGMWWVRTGRHRTVEDRVSLRSIAPTILTMLGVEVPDSMTAPPVDLGIGSR